MSKTCETCVFYGDQVCRRHPPQTLITSLAYFDTNSGDGHEAQTETHWPAVAATEWCGEHTTKPVELPDILPHTRVLYGADEFVDEQGRHWKLAK